jgi:hypothetical protein
MRNFARLRTHSSSNESTSIYTKDSRLMSVTRANIKRQTSLITFCTCYVPAAVHWYILILLLLLCIIDIRVRFHVLTIWIFS